MPEEAPKSRRAKRSENQAKRAAGAGKPKREAGEAKAKADVTARELIFMVSRVAAEFEALLKTKEPALSLSQWAMLEMLSQEDASTRPSQVARKLGFSRQLVRQATKKLLSLELVAKEAPEEGKKAVGLILSQAGRKALADIGASTDAISATLSANKRGGNISQAARTLKGLSAAMPAKPETAGKGRKKKDDGADAPTAEDAVEA